jgi:FtsH-binding integral membrane protein
MGPMLISSLFALVAWSFIQMFFPVGPLGETIYSLFGAVIFSGFIVYDTSNLIQKYDIDQVSHPLSLDTIYECKSPGSGPTWVFFPSKQQITGFRSHLGIFPQ